MLYKYKYPRAALSVDCVVFGRDGKHLKVLLIQRGQEPFKGCWALPGGFVNLDETLDEAARRELREETSLTKVPLDQLQAFSALHRDPRERVVSVAFYALVQVSEHRAKAGDDAASVQWCPVSKLPRLAFDHADILRTALARLRGKAK